EAGVIHRDLKASNIAVASKNGNRIIKLLDFGIAKLLESDTGGSGLTSVGRRMGTPQAMAPEQIRNQAVDARTDIYALGVLAFYLLTGQLPFQAPEIAEVERLHLEAPPPRPSTLAPVTPAVEAVVLRCMEKEPARRYLSVPVFLEALRQAVTGRLPSSAPGTAPAPAIALYLSVMTPASMDDALLGDLANVLHMARHKLSASGLTVPIQTTQAMLGVCPLPPGKTEAFEKRRLHLTAATELHDSLATRAGADPRISITVTVHVAGASVRTTEAGPEVIGGEILHPENWMPPDRKE